MNAVVDTVPAGLVRQKPFRRYLLGLAGDLIGDHIWFISMAWAATEMSGPRTASVVVGAAGIPRLILLLPAGAVIDRLGALKVAQAAQVVRGATMAVAAVTALTGSLNIPILLALAIIFGISDSARLPAANSLPPALLASDFLAQGQGWVATVSRVASVVAGPAVGIALAAGGVGAVALLNFVLFAIAFVSFSGLRPYLVTPDQNRAPAGLRAGLAYLARSRNIWPMLAVVAGLNLALAGPLNLGIVLQIRDQGWGPEVLGLIVGAFGLGAAAGALSLSVLRHIESPALWGFVWAALGALAIGAVGLTSSLTLTLLAATVAGIALGPSGALLIGFVQATTDEAYLGRVMSVVSFASFGLAPFGLMGFGFLVQELGLKVAFVTCGLIVVTLALMGIASPELRSAKSREDRGVEIR